MSGFPNTPARVAFGPDMQNVRAPVNSETDLGADQINLLSWQIAGAGRTVAQALIVFDGATPAIVSQTLAFDPRQNLANIAFVKAGTGLYTFTFASTYKNQLGVDTPFVPGMAIPTILGGAVNDSAQVVLTGQDVAITVRDAAGAAADATVQLQVWGG